MQFNKILLASSLFTFIFFQNDFEFTGILPVCLNEEFKMVYSVNSIIPNSCVYKYEIVNRAFATPNIVLILW